VANIPVNSKTPWLGPRFPLCTEVVDVRLFAESSASPTRRASRIMSEHPHREAGDLGILERVPPPLINVAHFAEMLPGAPER